MAKQPQKPLKTQVKGGNKLQPIELILGPTRDVPLTYANKVIINFTGTEFLVTIVSAFLDPWVRGQQPPKKVEGKIVGRYAFSIPEWVAASKSISNQIDRLQAEGAFHVELELESPEEEEGNEEGTIGH